MSGIRGQSNTGFDGFQKRSGLIVPFSWQKIELAIDRAVDVVARKHHTPKNEGLASKITDQVLSQLDNPQCEFYVHPDESGKRIPKIEDVQDLVEILLAENGETLTVASYKRYRKQREISRRRIRVRGVNENSEMDVADESMLLVESTSKNVNFPWDRKRIVKQILDKTDLSVELAINIAKSVENRIIASEMTVINTTLIRELVNNELTERGHSQQLRDLSLYRISKDYIENLLVNPSAEANPDATASGASKMIMKQWARDTIFSSEIKRAHDTGAIHIHHLGRPLHLQAAKVSVEYVKKYGLVDITRLNAASAPPETASALTSQLFAFLSATQVALTGPIDLEYLNVFYAPLLANMDESTINQVARDLVFNGVRSSITLGNRPLQAVFNLSTDIPIELKSIPAIGPGGAYQMRLQDGSTMPLEDVVDSATQLMDLYYVDPVNGRRLVLRELADETDGIVYDSKTESDLRERGEQIVKYADYSDEAQTFCRALLQAFGEVNASSGSFGQPLCKLHVTKQTVEKPAQFTLLRKACEQACYNGAMEFSFNRSEGVHPACANSNFNHRALFHPENKRSCNVHSIALNIPQAAYRAARIGGDILRHFYEELDRTVNLIIDAHLQKKATLAEMMSAPGRPLWQYGKVASDGAPQMNLETGVYGINAVGLNDAVKFLIGQELHESSQTQHLGLKIIAHLQVRARKVSKKHNLNFTIAEPPSAGAAHRLAKSDSLYFPEESKEILNAKEGGSNYANSTHLTETAALGLTEGIAVEAKFHSMIESGTAVHLLGSSPASDAATFAHTITEIFHRTQCRQINIPPAPVIDGTHNQDSTSRIKAAE